MAGQNRLFSLLFSRVVTQFFGSSQHWRFHDHAGDAGNAHHCDPFFLSHGRHHRHEVRSRNIGLSLRTVLPLGHDVVLVSLGLTMTTLSIYPSYILAQKINIGNFLERIKAILAILWIMTIFIKVSITFYAATISLSHILNISDARSLTFPPGTIVLGLSIISYPNVAYFFAVIGKVWFPNSLTLGFGIPLLILLVDFLKNRKGKKQPQKEEATPNPMS